MLVFIFSRRVVSENTLLLTGLSDNKGVLRIKLPHVLKSKKRNSFFLVPGTIWDFTFNNLNAENLIPVDQRLVASTVSTDSDYRQLALVKDLIEPLQIMAHSIDSAAVFSKIYHITTLWADSHESARQALTNHFLIYIMANAGLFNPGRYCLNCGAVMHKDDYYHLTEGQICKSCFSKQLLKESESVSYGWTRFFLEPDLTHKSLNPENIERIITPRVTILNHLKSIF